MPEDFGGTAVADAVDTGTSTDTSTDALDTSTANADSGANTDDSANTDQNQDANNVDADKQSGKGQKPRINLNEELKKNLPALKAINKDFASEVQSAVFRLGAFEKVFPTGGLKEAQALKATIDGIGGAEGIRETQEAVQDYQKLEALYEKGSGEFWDVLAESNPAALSSSMPSGLEKWRSVDADGYNHTMAQVMVQTLDGAKFSDTLAAIWERLPETAENKPLRDALASMWQTVEGYRKVADKAPERKVNPQDEALTKREREIAAREQKAFIAPVAQAGKAQLNQIVDSEMARSYQWSNESSDRQQAIRERIQTEMVAASKKDKAFADGVDRFRERGDAQGLQRHIQNFQQRVGPGIVERVARLFNVKPKGAGTVIAKPAQAAKPNGAVNRADNGWETIARQPKPAEMDMSRTTADMILANRGIMKNGKRVTWS